MAQSIAFSAIGRGLRWAGRAFAVDALLACLYSEGRNRLSFGTTNDTQLTGLQSMMRYYRLLAVALPICASCTVINKQIDPTSELAEARVRPGITVLLSDSIRLIKGKRIGLLTNQTGVNEKGDS